MYVCRVWTIGRDGKPNFYIGDDKAKIDKAQARAYQDAGKNSYPQHHDAITHIVWIGGTMPSEGDTETLYSVPALTLNAKDILPKACARIREDLAQTIAKLFAEERIYTSQCSVIINTVIVANVATAIECIQGMLKKGLIIEITPCNVYRYLTYLSSSSESSNPFRLTFFEYAKALKDQNARRYSDRYGIESKKDSEQPVEIEMSLMGDSRPD